MVGRWQTGQSELALVPRADIRGQTVLFGVVPRGPHEGVLSVSARDAEVWRGVYLPVATLEATEAAVRYNNSDDSLELEVAGTRSLRFRRSGPVDMTALKQISIIGHRGLSLRRDPLMNSIAGIRQSWLFGCTGVELDVTIPYGDRREPMPRMPRVHHPPEWRSEITGFDSMAVSELRQAPDLEAALRASSDAGLPFVYLDPKLRWLVRRYPDEARISLEQIVATASAHLAAGVRQTIAIGAETSGPGEAADLLTTLRRERPWPNGLMWALEVTRGTDTGNALNRLMADNPGDRPDLVSLNLLRITGGGGGLLRLFVRPISPEVEARFALSAQPVVFWTAYEERHFEGVLGAIRRLTPPGREAGIITPHPHRLAFYLATYRP